MSLHPWVAKLVVVSFKCRLHKFHPPCKCPCVYRPRSCTGACDLPQMGRTAALYNIDYYVVSPLTLMGCYSDLKWFNGSQVGTLMALFILQCLLWMWMTVLWSASVFFPHLLKQCDRCRFTGRVEGSREKMGEGTCWLLSPSFDWFLPLLSILPVFMTQKRLRSYVYWRILVWWERQDINCLQLSSTGFVPSTFLVYSPAYGYYTVIKKNVQKWYL